MLVMFSLPIVALTKTRILFIGDSITDGAWGNSGGSSKPSSERNLWDLNHIYGHGYVYLCAAYYQARYPSKDYIFYNRGISGNTLSDLEKRWTEDVIKLQPDILSILIGTNDINVFMKEDKEDFDFEDWEKRYRQLLDATLKINPCIKLVLCAPFVANTGKMRESTNYQLRERLVENCATIVKKIAEDYKAIYLPFNCLFRDVIQKTPDLQKSYWIWDGIHPTAAGHKLMSDMWIKRVNRYLLK